MNPKTLTLIIAAIAMATDAGAAIAGLLPPAWALVVGALVAGLTALDRALHNVAQGVSLKSYLTSPSAWAAALVIVASIISAIAGVVPVAYSASIAVFAGMVLRFARVLQTALQPASGVIPVASPGGLGTNTIPSAAEQARASASMPIASVSKLTPPAGTRRTGPGSSNLGVLVFLGASLFASVAFAQAPSPQAIGCIDAANTYCVVPAAAVGWQINLKTGGTANGVGLAGLVLQHTFGTIPLGVGLYGGLGASNSNQGSYQGCVGLSITNFGLMCIGAQHATFADNSTAWQGMLTFAGQLTFGGTPAYVAKQARLSADEKAATELDYYARGLKDGEALGKIGEKTGK